jgi:hypothetical protein
MWFLYHLGSSVKLAGVFEVDPARIVGAVLKADVLHKSWRSRRCSIKLMALREETCNARTPSDGSTGRHYL